MKKVYEDPIERILYYQSFLSGNEGSTIIKISDISQIDISVIRKDFSYLFASSFNLICFADEELSPISSDVLSRINTYYSDTVIQIHNSDELCDFMDKIRLGNRDDLDYWFKNGLFDDIPFKFLIEDPDHEYDNYVSVPVTVNEYLAYRNLFEQHTLPKKVSGEKTFITSTIRNKKHMHELDRKILNYLETLEFAVNEHFYVKFNYKNYKRPTSLYRVLPYKIGYDGTDNRYVLICYENGTSLVFDLERIEGEIHLSQRSLSIPIPPWSDVADKVWGFDYNSCVDSSGKLTKPTEVSVLFYNEANVIQKLNRDLTFRNPLELTEYENKNVLYRDLVYGKEHFLKWIYSYGSSAQIIAPSSLANEVVEKMKNRLISL